ncbi:MAG: hypothetical protein ACHQWU_01475 [Gemmatimonadales bacterium]
MSLSNTRCVLKASAIVRDVEPRVIQQSAALFHVSRCGELWRVFDSPDPGSAIRSMPSPTTYYPYRVFVALARRTELRVHTFTGSAPRTIDAAALQRQLDEATDQAARVAARCA